VHGQTNGHLTGEMVVQNTHELAAAEFWTPQRHKMAEGTPTCCNVWDQLNSPATVTLPWAELQTFNTTPCACLTDCWTSAPRIPTESGAPGLWYTKETMLQAACKYMQL
jgi:hypothetical protein